jgi:hypothetical protein
MCRNTQTWKSIIHHTKILLTDFPAPLSIQDLRTNCGKQNRPISNQLPCHLTHTDGCQIPLLSCGCPPQNSFPNQRRPQLQESPRKTTLPPCATSPRYQRRLQQHQLHPPTASHAAARHALIPLRMDPLIHHQSHPRLLLYPAKRRPQTFPMWPPTRVTSLTHPLPHLCQCNVRSTTPTKPRIKYLLC